VVAEHESGFALIETINDTNRFINKMEAQKLIDIAALFHTGAMDPLPPPEAAQERAAHGWPDRTHPTGSGSGSAAGGGSGRKTRAQSGLAWLTREDLTAKEVAMRLHLSDYAARRLVTLALTLTTRFPHTLTAMTTGNLDLRRAEIILEHAAPLAEHHYQQTRKATKSPLQAEHAACRIAGMLESQVVGPATDLTTAQLHPLVKLWVHLLDPDFADQEHTTDSKTRSVSHRVRPNATTGDLYAHLGATETLGVYTVIDAYARAARQTGSQRTLNELRADALVHLIIHGHLPDNTNPIGHDATSTTNGTGGSAGAGNGTANEYGKRNASGSNANGSVGSDTETGTGSGTGSSSDSDTVWGSTCAGASGTSSADSANGTGGTNAGGTGTGTGTGTANEHGKRNGSNANGSVGSDTENGCNDNDTGSTANRSDDSTNRSNTNSGSETTSATHPSTRTGTNTGSTDDADTDLSNAIIIAGIDPTTGDIYPTPPTDGNQSRPYPAGQHHRDHPHTHSTQDTLPPENHAETPTTTTKPSKPDPTLEPPGHHPDNPPPDNPPSGKPPSEDSPVQATPWTRTNRTRNGLPAHIQVVISLETLLGLNDHPADLTGHGPITAHTARDLAYNKGSTWRRLVTDPVSGYLLDHGRKTYRPPTALADHTRTRDYTCRTPNCTRPAIKCDLDHVISWPAGTTSEHNLATQCDHDAG
jgi:hypothetical protein